MFKIPFFRVYIMFGILAAICYALSVIFFIEKAKYADTWYLYVGNFFFMAVIVIFLFYISRQENYNSSTVALIGASEKTVLIGVIASIVFSFLILLVLVPDLFKTGIIDSAKPASRIRDRTNGLAFMIFINAVIGNFVTGSFVSVIFPVSIKSNQKSEKGSTKLPGV